MKFTFRSTAFPAKAGWILGCLMLCLVADSVNAAPPDDIKEPEGLVWFIGTVELVTDGVPTMDLGEVHTLREGNTVAAIRYRDGHFTPLGVMEVQFSHPTWCQMMKPRTFAAEIGDLVMFVESPGELGSGQAIRDAFIRHRVVANSNRNRYSTMRDSIEADTLQRVIEKQPNWVKGQRRIAGVIRSPSVSRDMNNRLKPFLNQIQTFQDYENQGVNVAQVTSDAWRDVLDELRQRTEVAETNSTETGTEAGSPDKDAEATSTENLADPDALLAVRRQVEEVMFQRVPAQRHVIAVICATLLQTKTSNERQWMALQLGRSQFAELGNQEQILIDMEAIMRRVRQTMNP